MRLSSRSRRRAAEGWLYVEVDGPRTLLVRPARDGGLYRVAEPLVEVLAHALRAGHDGLAVGGVFFHLRAPRLRGLTSRFRGGGDLRAAEEGHGVFRAEPAVLPLPYAPLH